MSQQIQDFNRLHVDRFATAKPVLCAQRTLLLMVGSGQKLGNLEYLGDRFPALLAAGMIIKAVKL